MDSSYSITTPENVQLEFPIAGLGSRFLAALIDSLALGTVLLVALIAGLIVAFGGGTVSGAGTIAVLAILVLVLFCIVFGYYIVLETVWSGQSLGKRALGLRVIRDDGLPLNFTASVIRNLIRIIDLLPGAYGFGVIAMFLNRRWKRLGDLAAGTLVVIDRRPELPPSLRLPSPEQLGMDVPVLARPLTQDEYSVGREYLLRYYTLSEPARESLGRSIAEAYEELTGVPRGPAEPWRYVSAVLLGSQAR
ncbi:MAG: RDD family protein [Chloroflexota bacterium]|nr:RDD family protein [Chloroflexota bacterium]